MKIWSVQNFFHEISWLRNDLTAIDADGFTMADILIDMLLFNIITGNIWDRFLSFLVIGLVPIFLKIGLVVNLYFVGSTWLNYLVLLAVYFRVRLPIQSLVVDFTLSWTPRMSTTVDWLMMMIYYIVIMDEIVMQSIRTIFGILTSQ